MARQTDSGGATHFVLVLVTFLSVVCRDYTPSYFFEELRGLSDASGVDYNLLLRVHMLPELIKVPPHLQPSTPVYHSVHTVH